MICSIQRKKISKFFYNGATHFLICLLLLMLTGCAKKIDLVHDLDEPEAIAILSVLANEGIDGNKVKSASSGSTGGNKGGEWMISIDEKDYRQAMIVLAKNGLPRKKADSLLSLFPDQGLVPSEMGQKIRKQQGINSEIANTIRNFDGILDVNVHISTPEEDGAGGGFNKNAPKKEMTAAVYVRHNGVLDDPNSHLITKIKRLVSASITGLDIDKVTVVPDKASLFTSIPQTLTPIATTNILGISVSKSSVTTLRIVLLSSFFFVLFLVGIIGFLVWKIMPVTQEYKGILFSFKQITPEMFLENVEEREVQESEENKEERKEQ